MEWAIIFAQRPLPLSFAHPPTFLCIEDCELTERQQKLWLHKIRVYSMAPFNYLCGKDHLKKQTDALIFIK